MAAFVKHHIKTFYEVVVRLPSKYFNWEHLFWEALMMGIGFPMYMSVNCVVLARVPILGIYGNLQDPVADD
ncbi:hypothetical protein DSO57_1031858 [Entomophthora muscae]|uniref:Uncharacterized protein n=1 Tax=Entomophthora muscae TaxID=34485 RepID=A0ACC2TBE7_9FUNG|nr:hypothetical protein DSO57_1031858 [Entomophthora muscae]